MSNKNLPAKQKYTITNQRNFVFIPDKHLETVGGVSETVPDQSFTIQQILEKFTRGVDPMLTRNPSFEDDVNIDDDVISINDLTDLDEAEEFINEIEEKKKAVKEMRKKSEKGDKNSVT